jgi:hypothetical protein
MFPVHVGPEAAGAEGVGPRRAFPADLCQGNPVANSLEVVGLHSRGRVSNCERRAAIDFDRRGRGISKDKSRA